MKRALMRRSVVAAALVWLSDASVAAELSVVSTSFGEEWVEPTEPIAIKLSRLPEASEGRLRFFVGSADLTALFRPKAPGVFVYEPRALPLTSGENEVHVYLAKPSQPWQEVATVALRVLTASGFEQEELTPRWDMTFDSRIAEGHNSDAAPPERATYADWDMQGGLATLHARTGLEIGTQFNLVGTTRQEKALRFGEMAEDAPKLDLGDYLVEVKRGQTNASLGHIAYGSNPLLMSSYSSRGLMLQHRLNNRFDVSLSALNGRQIVGWDNLTGLADIGDNSITAATVGYDALAEKPGDLRFELMYMYGEIRSDDNFDVGEITDAEKSSGYGLRVTGSTPSGRLRGDVAYARSKYTNPDDPALSDGFNIIEVQETTNEARYAQLEYDLLQNQQLFGETYAALTLMVRHERTDPFYQTLGVFANSDIEVNQAALNGLIGDVSMQLSHMQMEDNLDDIANLLKTETKNWSFHAEAPLATLFDVSGDSSVWVPALSYDYQWTNQKGVNQPDGFDPSHIPDQRTEQHNLGLSWSGALWTLAYNMGFADQDNLQEGRANADFVNWDHDIQVSYRWTDDLDTNFGVGYTAAEDKEADLDRYARRVSAGFNWRINDRWNLAGDYSYTWDDDSDDLQELDSLFTQTQLSYRFEVPVSGKNLPAQFFLRHDYQSNKTQDNVFAFTSEPSDWGIYAGLNISVF